jgi:hypothetical protein
LIDVLILSLAIGLWSSSVTESRVKAPIQAFVTLLILLLLPAIIARVAGGWAAMVPGVISPLTSVFLGGDKTVFWISSLVQPLIAGMYLINTAKRLRLFAEEKAGHTNEAASSHCNRTPRIRLDSAQNPILWLVSRQRTIRFAVWAGTLINIASAFLTSALFFLGPRITAIRVTGIVGLGFGVIANALFAWSATQFFWEARRDGELELLSATPVGARAIVYGNWIGLKRIFTWPAVLIILASSLWLVYYRTWTSADAVERLWLMFVWLGNSTETLLHLAATCWIGMWLGFKARSRFAAIAGTLFLPLGTALFINRVSLMLSSQMGFQVTHGFQWVFRLCSLLLQLACFIGLISFAKKRLLSDLAAANDEPLALGRELAGWLAKAMRGARR